MKAVRRKPWNITTLYSNNFFFLVVLGIQLSLAHARHALHHWAITPAHAIYFFFYQRRKKIPVIKSWTQRPLTLWPRFQKAFLPYLDNSSKKCPKCKYSLTIKWNMEKRLRSRNTTVWGNKQNPQIASFKQTVLRDYVRECSFSHCRALELNGDTGNSTTVNEKRMWRKFDLSSPDSKQHATYIMVELLVDDMVNLRAHSKGKKNND